MLKVRNYDGKHSILLHGRVVQWDQTEFEARLLKMGKKRIESVRATVALFLQVSLSITAPQNFKLTAREIQTSCGHGIPRVATAALRDL